MNKKLRILFICQHNSGRSQIAAGYLNKFGGEHLDIESAGLEPADGVNPLVLEVMQEEGFDLARSKPQSVFNLFKQGKLYDHVITVCADTETKCPLFPGITKRWHWPFPDPAAVEGTHAEKNDQVRKIRDMIKDNLLNPPEGAFSFRSLIPQG